MKKTVFIKSYQIFTMILKISFALMIFSIVSKLFAVTFEISSFTSLRHFSMYVNLANDVSVAILFILAISLSSISLYLIVHRYKNDQIRNLMRSIDETWELHHFLKHNESTPIIPTAIQQVNKSNKVTREFNRSAKRSIVDVQNDTVTIYIQIPRSQQAQRILQEMNSQLKEQLSNRMPDYYFSNGTREKNILWIEGKKR
ncbi:hypothetical protein [Candidatus Enterococcus ferrettii]|uniref:Alkaline shock response membrane anchor protein AmaP n=1 Tax=Candidatus Enterococcus ferrettii TaxID=2815324 RepID=A0ABV0EKN9_9ENTE|nr:hypothetical protein [Enterococcus sp. 665A]MBO1342725.1 hypothetical protein [Enterococcus sp. 665A]